MEDRKICGWDDTQLFHSEDGLIISKNYAKLKNPCQVKVSASEAAKFITAEKYDFSQEELLALSVHEVLPELIKTIREKYKKCD